MPPSSDQAALEAEKAVLGGALLTDTAMKEVIAQSISPDDFNSEAHRKIYAAMIALHHRNAPVDLVTVMNEIGPKINRIGGPAYLSSLTSSIPSLKNVSHYGQIVKQNSKNRKQISTPTVQEPAINTKQIVSVDIDKFLQCQFPPRNNILDSWLPRQGLAMVYAGRGVGKTFFSLSLAYQVASAGCFLKWSAKQPSGVLYLDGEMPAAVMQERLARIIASSDKEPQKPFRIITPDMQNGISINLARHEDQELIEQHLEGIDLIVVDNISTLCVVNKENEGDSWLPVQAWCLKQRAAGKSILLVHHAGKGGQQRGTSRREDILDTVIALRHPANYSPELGACFEIHFEKSRGIYGEDTKPFEASLTTDDAGKQTWLVKSIETSTAEKVAQLLAEGMSQSEIVEELGITKGAVSKAKKRAAAMGLIG